MPASCAIVEISPVLCATRACAGRPGGNAAPELLLVQDVEHLARELRRERALFGDESQQLNEPVRGHAVVDSMLERELVLDAAPEIDARQTIVARGRAAGTRCRASRAAGSSPGCCCGRSCVRARSLTRIVLPIAALDLGVGVALGQHAEGAAVERAAETIAHVQPRLRQQLAVDGSTRRRRAGRRA